MGGMFTTVTPEDMMKNSLRLLRNGTRELEREIKRMQQEESKLKNELKDLAIKGQIPASKVLSKQIVRNRNAIARFYELTGQLKGVATQVRSMNSITIMESAMKSATKSLYMLNRQIPNGALQQIMITFEKEGQAMELKQEIMNDTIDDVLSMPNDEADENLILEQILDEIGISTGEVLMGTKPPTTQRNTPSINQERNKI